MIFEYPKTSLSQVIFAYILITLQFSLISVKSSETDDSESPFSDESEFEEDDLQFPYEDLSEAGQEVEQEENSEEDFWDEEDW